jgi:hypothetical protein
MHPRGLVFFFLGQMVVYWVFWFFSVPNVFTLCSHQVPKEFSSSSQCVPQDLPNSTTRLPICFAQSYYLFTYTANPKGRPPTSLPKV